MDFKRLNPIENPTCIDIFFGTSQVVHLHSRNDVHPVRKCGQNYPGRMYIYVSPHVLRKAIFWAQSVVWKSGNNKAKESARQDRWWMCSLFLDFLPFWALRGQEFHCGKQPAEDFTCTMPRCLAWRLHQNLRAAGSNAHLWHLVRADFENTGCHVYFCQAISECEAGKVNGVKKAQRASKQEAKDADLNGPIPEAQMLWERSMPYAGRLSHWFVQGNSCGVCKEAQYLS